MAEIKIKTYKGPGNKQILINIDEGFVEFVNYTFEKFAPKRYSSKRILFEAIGTMNSQWVVGGDQDDIKVLLTKEGRTSLSTDIEGFSELVYSMEQIYKTNIEGMSESQARDFDKQMLKTPFVGKVLIAILLIAGIAGVVYYFTIVLPNLKV